MQPHDSNQCTEASDSHGRRYAQWTSRLNEALVDVSQTADLVNWPVRVAEPNKPLDLFAGIGGKGGLAA